MTAETVNAILEQLAEIRAVTDLTRADYESKRQAIMAQVQGELDALEAEYAPSFSVASERSQALEREVRSAVLELGESVRGEMLHAVYARGRMSWNGSALLGYAAAHPEIMQFQEIGTPSVSIRLTRG